LAEQALDLAREASLQGGIILKTKDIFLNLAEFVSALESAP